MNHTLMRGALAVALGLSLALAWTLSDSQAQTSVGTAFTYQGRLASSGAPVNGPCDFQFSLWNAASGGTQIGSTQTYTSVSVSAGYFTIAALDFGAAAFNGQARWLAVAVRCPAGSGSYTALSPRQRLTPAPYALALPGLWTQQTGASPNLIGGFHGNQVTNGVVGATIGGGGNGVFPNRVTDSYGTVGGGFNNQAGNFDSTVDNKPYATVGGGVGNSASGEAATVGGGGFNTASGNSGTVGGGYSNVASGEFATVDGGGFNTASNSRATVSGGFSNAASGNSAAVGGGFANTASGLASTVGGGQGNTASGLASTVGGGESNTAAGDYSFVAGRQARNANGTHSGVFIFADSTNADFVSTGPNQFLVRATGGVGVNTNSPIANTLTVNGQVIAGGANPPGGAETFTSQGSASGISMDDRAGGSNPRWVIYPNNGTLAFWTSVSGNRVTINSSGKLTAVGGFNGQCLSSSNFNASFDNACNMDVAESFASLEQTEPGDLVVLDPNATERPTVRRSVQPYEALLVGAVSTNPGLVFDNGRTFLAGDNSQLITADKTVVGLVGRVPVKVSMENGPIAIGDPLTSASKPGVAMKATRAGKIVGYAMQAADTDGKVLVLLQPGYYLPPDHLALQEQNAEQQARISALEARLTALEHGAQPARSSTLDWSALGFALLGVLGGGTWLLRARSRA